MLLKIGLYFIPEAQNLHAMIFFDFKAIGPGKRGGYRGGIIKNHQKTMSKRKSKGIKTHQNPLKSPRTTYSAPLKGRYKGVGALASALS